MLAKDASDPRSGQRCGRRVRSAGRRASIAAR